MDLRFLEQVAATLGVAGLGIGVFFLLMRSIVIRTDLFERINQVNTFRFLRLVAILSFVVAILGLVVYAFLRFFIPEATAEACGNFRSIVTTNVTINCSGLPLRERQSNFDALLNDLEAFEDYSFGRLANSVSREASVAQKNRDVKDRAFWITLGEGFYKHGSRLNRAYRDLALCLARGGCAIADGKRANFCQSAEVYYRRILETNQIFTSLSVGLTIQQVGAEALIPDNVVRLPETENLQTIVKGYCRPA